MRKDGTANSNCVLSIDGTTIPGEEEKYTAVYMETIDGVTTSYEGVLLSLGYGIGIRFERLRLYVRRDG